jgi:hypothetical protein
MSSSVRRTLHPIAWRIAFASVVLCASPARSTAQTPGEAVALVPAPNEAGERADSTAPQPPLQRPSPRFWGAALDVTAINTFAVLANLASGQDFARLTPKAWATNLGRSPDWDTNEMKVNQLDHPYHGGAYHNAARANGFSFWGSTPFVVAGSLMWEFLGETKRASTNDIVATSFGGIALGEATYLLTSRLVDDEARGLDRLWHEAAVALLNPGLGMHRILRGESWRRRVNVGAPRPPVRLQTDAGGRAVGVGGGALTDKTVLQPVLGMRWRYGDPLRSARVGAFDAFELRLEVSAHGSSPISGLEIRAPLTGRTWGGGDGRWLGLLHMRYYYASMPGLQRSDAEIGLTVGRELSSGPWRLAARASIGALPVAAISSADFRGVRGRRGYDYASGAIASAGLNLQQGGVDRLRFEYRGQQLYVLDGVAQRHTLHTIHGEGRLPVRGRMSLGISGELFEQRSSFADGTALSRRLPRYAVFVSLAD